MSFQRVEMVEKLKNGSKKAHCSVMVNSRFLSIITEDLWQEATFWWVGSRLDGMCP